MKIVTQCYKFKPENVKNIDIDKVMKNFQFEMKLRYRIPPFMVEKYKDDLCFVVEIKNTCMEAMIPRVKFIEPMVYEMSTKLIKGYAQIILKSEKDTKCPRWGTYD